VACFLLSSFGINSTKAFHGDITINEDGSVSPPDAPVSRTGNTYVLTDNIQGSIVVGKDYITVDGQDHAIQGPGNNGIFLSLRTNVTIQRLTIESFSCGIYLAMSNQNAILQTNVINNNEGIYLSFSSNNNIRLNLISTNDQTGIFLDSSSNNNILGNKITNNSVGIYIQSSANNNISHNDFTSNAQQVYTESSTGTWDNGYPSGGNYWSDYAGIDVKRGSGQNEAGSDGVGDTAYSVDASSFDLFPLMKPYAGPHDIGITLFSMSKTIVGQGYPLPVSVKIVNYGEQLESFNLAIKADSTTIQTMPVTLTGRNSITISLSCPTSSLAKGSYSISAFATPVSSETDTSDNTSVGGLVSVSIAGDVNADRKVDLKDVYAVGKAYGSRPQDPNWDPNLDINSDGIVDLKDYFVTCKNYGQSW
jgi:parallel beta-helix repeat protein